MARLEGGGDYDKAALRLVGPQEDTARVDVDGAGSPVLQAVHAVLPVLFHLPMCTGRGGWATRMPRPLLPPHPLGALSTPTPLNPHTPIPVPAPVLPPVNTVTESASMHCPEKANGQRPG